MDSEWWEKSHVDKTFVKVCYENCCRPYYNLLIIVYNLLENKTYEQLVKLVKLWASKPIKHPTTSQVTITIIIQNKSFLNLVCFNL